MDIFYYYKAKVVRVVSGDTIEFEVDLGFDLKMTDRFKLLGINAPEARAGSLAASQVSTEFLRNLLERATVSRKQISIKSVLSTDGKQLCDLWIDTRDVAEIMVENGQAVVYSV